MKILAALLMTLTFNTYAQTHLSKQDQKNVVESFAKEIRRELWVGHYENVTTHVKAMDTKLLSESLKGNSDFESPLDIQTIKRLSDCVSDQKECSLFLIHLGSSIYGGDGYVYIWVLMNPENAGFETIKHSVYEE